MKKTKEVKWNENGWTIMQNADAANHVLEISCYAEDGTVTEIRKRHAGGEEEKLTKKIDATHSLPISLAELKDAFFAGTINWK